MRCCWILVAACATSRPAPKPVERERTPPIAAVAPAHDAPSEADCDALFTHAFAIVIAARAPAPSDADQATVRGELRPQFIADCRAGSRAYHQCGLAAKTVVELEACR